MFGACGMHGIDGKHKIFVRKRESLKGRDHSEDLVVVWKIVLEWILRT